MLERLAAWVLNNYLGRYVENLNTDQLSIALLSGQVELENLPLKKDALRHLGLPVEIKAGFIGKVKLQIPVSQLRSAPWVINVEQLYLVATPLPVQEWNVETEELAAQEIKLSNLDRFEARWRFENESRDNAGYYASSYSSWLSYGTGLITNIIENLQLKIKDVHIRYEDSISIPEKAVAFGVTMESLSAQSCDSNWIPGFSQWDSSGMSYKLVEMQKLAMYWVEMKHSETFANLPFSELANVMGVNQSGRYSKQYILAPVSAQAQLKRDRSERPLKSGDSPRIVCDLCLEEVPLALVDWQYDQIVKCTKGLDDIASLRTYRWYRPPCSISEDPRAWWLYAISCLYPGGQPSLCRPKPTWDTCLTRAKQNVHYVHVYVKILTTPSVALTGDEKKLKDTVEWERDFDDLKALREVAMRKAKPVVVRNGNGGGQAGRSVLVNWFPQWIGWYSSPSTETPQPETAQLEDEILQALSDTADNQTVLKRDAVFGQFTFTLKSGTLNLCTMREDSSESAPMLELQFKNLSVNILSKPRTSSHVVELSLGAIYLRDKMTLNSLFPVLVGPPGQERLAGSRNRGLSPRVSVTSLGRFEETVDELFHLTYEKKPPKGNFEYRLCVKSKCLDVVYQPDAVKWLCEFLCLPHQRNITQSRIEAMKSRTKKELIKNWEQMLDGKEVTRTNWELELDISAPQIIFVERFKDPNSVMAVVDFGRLQLRNNLDKPEIITTAPVDLVAKESEEDEMFVTPCSTPPASEESELEVMNNNETLNEHNIHHILYDRYSVELTDLQVLVGKVKDNWRYAHNKGTSTLHVLDRFNISLHIERRVVHTSDPLYPSFTLNANLPKLVAHFNEGKIAAARTLTNIITAAGLPSPFLSPETTLEVASENTNEEDETSSVDTSIEMSRLFMLQFTIDQVSLEVQSRGRSVAELQVSGVKIAFTKRPLDVSIMLTVHSLLLVDALQTFGPDFELLVASHRHVGMDSMSGSLRDSEPTSPISPGSPDPNLARPTATSPIALSQALTSLASSPPMQMWLQATQKVASVLDAEALITVEVMIVTGQDPMRIANIQFNNLDIIANQETLVELMGFIRRVFPEIKSQKPTTLNLATVVKSEIQGSTDVLDGIEEDTPPPNFGMTELTFDFHRLNILLLRGMSKEGTVVGKKICTATMSEAKIQATVGSCVEVEGSLGGLQVLDLTPEGHMHQRIVSVGRDPVLDSTHPLYTMSSGLHEDEKKAFSFKVVRTSDDNEGNDMAEVTIRMASLWYTHSPQFLVELQSCATEFKQYLANLARSIRTAATDMALGLVQSRTEALAQSLYMNSRLSASLYGSALSFSDIASPRRRRRSSSMEQTFSGYSSARDTIPQTPYSPSDDADFVINMKLDIDLETPVVVLPRANNSLQVFVAHLGKITIRNHYPEKSDKTNGFDPRVEHYDIEVREMNLFSLDTTTRRMPGPLYNKPEVLYNCDNLAKPILHDTIVQLAIDREVVSNLCGKVESEPCLLFDNEESYSKQNGEVSESGSENIQINGTVITALKVSLTRSQYEQLLDTIQWLTVSPVIQDSQDLTKTTSRQYSTLTDIKEEDTGVATLNMDPHVRAKLFPSVVPKTESSASKNFITVKAAFELPVFTVELRGDSPTGEQGLVDLSFRDFVFIYEKIRKYETNIQVSLRSIFMEDLLQPEDCKQRAMVISSSGKNMPASYSCVSRSCPEGFEQSRFKSTSHGSLPDHLETAKVFGMEVPTTLKSKPACPCTPPPSPSIRERPEQNLVLISTLIVDPSAPNFDSYYNSIQRSTSVDFNCLDLVVSVESWVVVIDFFSASPSNSTTPSNVSYQLQTKKAEIPNENTETNISVRSLTVVLVKPELEVAKANISNVEISIKTSGNERKEVEGKLGSISLMDLTLHGQLYRERFSTSGKQALLFNYARFPSSENNTSDAKLKLKMSSVIYVHTKRFIAEIQAFFKHFTQLHAVMRSIRAATSGQMERDEPLRLSLSLHAGSPMILLPVSSRSSDVLVADLGRLVVTNCFRWAGDEETISVMKNAEGRKCLLDVMSIDLQNMDLYAAVREDEVRDKTKDYCFKLGSCVITKKGSPLLTENCHLKIQVERNLDSNICHNVPDMSIHGQLSTLDCTLDRAQYRLIHGLLAFNLGEDTERILPSVSPPPVTAEPNIHEVWTLSSLRFDLSNVTVRLQISDNTPLSCINFIRSKLTIESFSNMCQDVDLVSQEILIRDTRFEDSPENVRSNIFTNILQPINYASSGNDIVQAEVHSRSRRDYVEFTILLNNMRLMAILDWWEEARDFILQDISNIPASPVHHKEAKKREPGAFELKLNITDSEIVVVENMAQWDTNAVILKSTTVLTYKPMNLEKPLSCSLNNCEMFSCILGMEDDTALSIIDPVTLNMDVNREKLLEIQLHLLTIRLSYYDMRMFLQMLNSLPKQMLSGSRGNGSKEGVKDDVSKLVALGFKTEDCLKALEICEGKLDDAALWLTQNAVPSRLTVAQENKDAGNVFIKAVEVKADCISLCIIDDCGDADVPLLELSLSDMNLLQNLIADSLSSFESERKGSLECVLASDYYNRFLSGWEPIIEPWKCVCMWSNVTSTNGLKNQNRITIESNDVFNLNVTSTLKDLYYVVKDNWMQDLYKDPVSGSKQLVTTTGYRRRAPFIPFELKNDTGSVLFFTTLISEMDKSLRNRDYMQPNERWVKVAPGETVPFSFKARDKLRHRDSHKMKMHQLGVKVEGWQPITPVTVDQVGVYFRHAASEIHYRNQQDAPEARIVFDVALKGSAGKLVTVRSALLIVNKLPETVELKLESQLPKDTDATFWAASKVMTVNPGETLAVPLVHAHSLVGVRPTETKFMYTFCTPQILWNLAVHPGDVLHELRACHTHRGHSYRFCAEIRRENYPTDRAAALHGVTGQWTQPAHTITLLPSLLLVNLLPVDLNYCLEGVLGRIQPGNEAPITYVDTDNAVELKVCLENFPYNTNIVVPAGCVSTFTSRVNMEDSTGRKLYLQAVITPNSGARIKITVSAQYWIINKTGLPLVFRQHGVAAEAAGQFEEHEIARMVAPLLFSFADQDASPTVSARVGTHVISDGSPQWCQSFHLQKGIQVRKLKVTLRDGRPDVVFIVGIEVRIGRGKYRSTTIVTITPRFQLYNKSSYQLLFAQMCFTSELKSQKTYLKAMPDCYMPFHWPRLDKEQLLCVLIEDIQDCCWSGGLKIDQNCSMHVSVRDVNFRVYFLRLEVILQGATFFIVFTDADRLPPPMRIDNYSEVTVTFAQACCKDLVHSTARAHSSVPYAWDQPTQGPLLTVTAPGGVCRTYDMNKLGDHVGLSYENFIYIAFTGTFKSNRDILDPISVENQELVLDVVNTNQVVLARKRQGQRSQLWRMTPNGQLQHEGSSPPSHPNQKRSDHNVLVLDIEGLAPHPSSYAKLVLRRPDPRRRTTQTWHFTDEGRLCCNHYNMCVQAQDGFFGLRPGGGGPVVASWQQWSAAVLGLPQPVCYQVTENGIPLEQAVSRQRLRPGSGLLAVRISMDGPTRVLTVWDIKVSEERRFAKPDEREWVSISKHQHPQLQLDPEKDEALEKIEELQVTVRLSGIGVSLVSRKPEEELLYTLFTNIIGEVVVTPKGQKFCVSILDIQVDNQLFDAPVPVVIYVTPPGSRGDDEQQKMVALEIAGESQNSVNENAVLVKYFMSKMKKMTIVLEELLILKLFSFIGFTSKEEELFTKDENDYETQRMLTEVSAAHAKRYYFGVLQLIPKQLRLSMKTANKIPPHLQSVKRKLGLTLIKFEDAAVDLQGFDKTHLFETREVLVGSIIKHFKDELKWQAYAIFSSVDFLGNPLGFVNDVSEGVSGMIYERSVEPLFKNVAHAIFNSTAKVTETLSDGLGKVTMDDEHEEMRQRIRQGDSHIMAGIKGFGFGILGGATGIFKQAYEGAANEGVQGLVSGIGKGIVGAVTKPVVGLLDLTSETARAVRDSSKSRTVPERTRPPRCVFGPGGLLPRFNVNQALGQQYLYLVNNRNFTEHLLAYEILRSVHEDLRMLISNQKIRIVTCATKNQVTTVIECNLSDFESCKTIAEREGTESRHYIEITMHVSNSSSAVYQDAIKKPKVRCDSADLAKAVTEQLNYAKRLHIERMHTLITGDTATSNED